MLTPSSVQDLITRLSSKLPPHLAQFKSEIESYLQSELQIFLHSLDLVSREDFEVQAKVLLKTRKKLEALEQRVKNLCSPL